MTTPTNPPTGPEREPATYKTSLRYGEPTAPTVQPGTATATPRTDEQEYVEGEEQVSVVSSYFARTLERELQAAHLRADCLATDVKVWAKAHAETLAKQRVTDAERSGWMP